MQSKLFTSSPHSLEYPRMPAQPAEPSGLRRALLMLGGFYSKESRFMRAAQGLYAGAVVEQATHPKLLAGEALRSSRPAASVSCPGCY